MIVKFYIYTKEKILFNKAPWLDEATAKTFDTVKIAGDQNIETPVLTVSGTGTNGLINYTYCYIQDWDRYYFITTRRWLADDVYQLTLSEDYIYTAKSILEVQTGFCRYSGLGDKNLDDKRIQLERKNTIDTTTYTPTTGTFSAKIVMKYITLQTDTLGNTVSAEAVAIMNEYAWLNFLYNYYNNNTPEDEKVIIGRYITSIAYCPYLNINDYVPGVIPLTPPPSTTFIRFAIPDSASPVLADIDISTGLFSTGAKCWIIPNMFSIDTWINSATGLIFNASGLNSGGDFWKLNGMWILKIPFLDPISIKPETLGVSDNFTLTAYITYEPFNGEYIITLGTTAATPDTINTHKWQQIKQSNKLRIGFISDSAQNDSLLRYAGTVLNVIGAGVSSIALENPLPVLTTGINAITTTHQQAMQEQLSFSVSRGDSGSIDFAAAGVRTPTLYNIYNAPKTGYTTLRVNKGLPDNTFRSILSLSGTGYAEVDIVDIVDNVKYLTVNELAAVREQMTNGVIFNAVSP